MWMLEFLERLIPPSNRKLRVDYIEPWISGSGPPECECIRNHFHPRTALIPSSAGIYTSGTGGISRLLILPTRRN